MVLLDVTSVKVIMSQEPYIFKTYPLQGGRSSRPTLSAAIAGTHHCCKGSCALFPLGV